MYNDWMPSSLCDIKVNSGMHLKHLAQCLVSRKLLKVAHLIYSFSGVNINVEISIN